MPRDLQTTRYEYELMSQRIDAERLAQITHLSHGAHASRAHGTCAMEAAAYIAGEPWSDSPECVSPVIGAFLRAWNDALPDDERDALILPLLPHLPGTRATPEVEDRRATMAADWLIREHASAWLRLAGLTMQADALSRLPVVHDFADAALRDLLRTAQRDASAAWDEAWTAAWTAAEAATEYSDKDAARIAAKIAFEAAVGDVLRAAAGAAAWDAAAAVALTPISAAARIAAGATAGSSSRAAAKSAVGDVDVGVAKAKLASTRDDLQRSALALVARMIETRNP